MKFVFFSMRDFLDDGGGTIRMYGILNSIAAQGHEVIFISNTKRYDCFNQKITHVPVNFFNQYQSDKRKFQFLLSILPAAFVYMIYKKLFDRISQVLKDACLTDQVIISFEYLDNSIVYVLKKQNKIKGYINDTHGIPTVEFKSAVEIKKGIYRVVYFLKYIFAKLLDEKLYANSNAYIFPSENVKIYYEQHYISKIKPKAYIIPYFPDTNIERTVDNDLKNMLLNKFKINDTDFVFFFAGNYKATSGIEDLLDAFQRLSAENNQIKLIVICQGISKILGVKSGKNIIVIDKISYDNLYTYQSIANVIVCPDRMNLFSNMIIHVKYFDSLVSGKVVINGSFDSVKKINTDDCLSLSFEPSNIVSLYNAMKYALENYDYLNRKYIHVKDYVFENMTYNSYIKVLTEQ
jgi:glycosyltransferase involved in cell wall biosynthesis